MNELNKDEAEVKPDFKNEIKPETGEEPQNSGLDENAGLDSFVEDEIKTKAETISEETEIKHALAKPVLSEEQAAEMALKGLNSILSLSSQMAGKPIDLVDEGKMIFAAVTTPLFMKYGDKIQKAMSSPSNVDLDSYMPEVLGIAAVIGVSIPIYLQVKAVDEVTDNGNQSE